MPPWITLEFVPNKEQIVALNQHRSTVDTAGIVCKPIGLVAQRGCSFFLNGALACTTASPTSEKGPRLERLEVIQIADSFVNSMAINGGSPRKIS